jgi:chromatin segregation and condensation protein Rec8/ScpA/Scc1 (kleisin family)
MTMSEKLGQIRSLVVSRGEISVREVFALARSKRELILTFLAFLELVKETEILLIQQKLFGEIIARRRTKEEETPEAPAAPAAEAH